MAACAVSVVEYGIGNIQSVVNACRRAGGQPTVARSGEELAAQQPDRIVLPGVGAVGEALTVLRARRLDTALQDKVFDEGVPVLGICVGMQMMAAACEEFGAHRGLGWIEGTVRRLASEGSSVRLPHVGWNDIAVDPVDPVLGALDGTHFYFQHSYAMECDDAHVIARAEYHGAFVCGVRSGHVAGVQFHPEKSSVAGTDLLARFLGSAASRVAAC